ncbi:MAG: DUF2256 domain-containing protein [Fuerstiella sp.]|nr:DUF2256 domain-containing protein [Fuerstiella sp.]
MVAKRELPSRNCRICKRPFTWRKKWASVWDSVRYCSRRCRQRRSQLPSGVVDNIKRLNQ